MQSRLRAFAMALFLIAVYTVVIKFITPVATVIAEHGTSGVWRQPPIMLDFWWIVHIWLGLWFWFRHPLAWQLGFCVSVVEIIIVIAKFTAFIPSPEFTLWRINWFINKCFVLALFVLLLMHLLQPRVKVYLSRNHLVAKEVTVWI
jgi:hypothetical protein